MALSGEQIDRYSRQILVAEIGGRGQERLLATRVGCHGSSACLDTAIAYLAASGIEIDAGNDADLLLVAAESGDGFAIAGAGATRPMSLVGTGDGIAWYSRRTSTGDCPHCIAAAVGGAREDGCETAPLAAIAGAALALDVIADIVGFGGTGRPEIVAFSGDGTERRIVPLSTIVCPHRVGSAGAGGGLG